MDICTSVKTNSKNNGKNIKLYLKKVTGHFDLIIFTMKAQY